MRPILVGTILVFGTACLAEGIALGDDYPLDALDRDMPEGGLDCQALERALVTYEGTHMRFRPPAKVHPAFAERLARFEIVVETLAKAVYGRAPRAVRNGTFRCRPMKRNERRVSEHALGNALDVVAFEFDFVPLGERSPDLPTKLARAFTVRVDRHWNAPPAEAAHACFLRTLARRLARRGDVFRGMIGPPEPDHHDHLHLDAGPWRFERFGAH